MAKPDLPAVLLMADCGEDGTLLRFHLEGMRLFVHEENLLIAAPSQFSINSYDALIMCSGESTIQVAEACRIIRRQSDVPIITVLPPGNTLDEDLVLDAGANDFLYRPVRPRTLSIRVHHQLRLGSLPGCPEDNDLSYGIFQLNHSHHRFSVSAHEVHLTASEFRLMALLMEDPERVFNRGQIIDAIGSFQGKNSDHLVDNHVSRIRQKIRAVGGPDAIGVVHGVGFRLEPSRAVNHQPPKVG